MPCHAEPLRLSEARDEESKHPDEASPAMRVQGISTRNQRPSNTSLHKAFRVD
jgi:hypothetical protein